MKTRTRYRSFAFITLFAFFVGTSTVVAQEGSVPLRYEWQKGDSFHYEVKIETDRGDFLETYTGTPSYVIRNADKDSIEIEFRGHLNESHETKPGKRIVLIGPRSRAGARSPFTGLSNSVSLERHELKINSRGELISMKGSSQLPLLLGNLSQLMLEPLPEAAEKSWTNGREISISTSSSRSPRSFFAERNDKEAILAKEKSTCSITEQSDDIVTIKKTYELRSVSTEDGKPTLEISGEGTLIFDRKQKATARLDFRETIISRSGNTTTEVPLTISYRLLSSDEVEALAAKVATGQPQTATKKQLSDQERETVLSDLKTGDQNRYLKWVLQLQNIIPAEADDEMAAALAIAAASENQATRFSAFRALENWGTQENIALLLKAMDDSFTPVQTSAIKTLSRLRAEEAIDPIANKLAVLQTRTAARVALVDFGSGAEPAVLKLLEHEEWAVRAEACQVLAAIGTKKSEAALKAAQNDENALVRSRSKKALEEIQERAE